MPTTDRWANANRLLFVVLYTLVSRCMFSTCVAADSPTMAAPDFFCGARSVAFVLDYYRIGRPPFARLAFELSHKDPGTPGSSFDDIRCALESRGIFTQALRVEAADYLTWDYPIIVHLTGDHFKDGHFCVWLPSSDERAIHLYMADSGGEPTTMTPKDFAKVRSGYILLTARRPVSITATAHYRPRPLAGLLLIAVTVSVCAYICLSSVTLARSLIVSSLRFLQSKVIHRRTAGPPDGSAP